MNSPPSHDTAGTDDALAKLQMNLASLQKEKEAKQATITDSLIVAPKNRYDAARKEKLLNRSNRAGLNTTSGPSSPQIGAISSPYPGAGPTSAPTSEGDLKLQAMKTSVIHLLACEPLTKSEILSKTRIPGPLLDTLLPRLGREEGGKWHLSDKAYKDLDVWKFHYPTQAKRQKAVDNAVRAYDRMRVERDNQAWQLLLPKEERGMGKCLSRLHLGGGQVNRGLTPSYQPSPRPHNDEGGESRAASAVNTPKMGPSTPRPGSAAGDVRKRLLAKDPQKARAAENAKEKKRKEREVAASDRESARPAKKQATKKANVKSEEIVHSSDDDSEEQPIKEKRVEQRVEQNQSSPEKTKPAPKIKSKAVVSTSSDSSDTPIKDKAGAKAVAKPKPKAADSSAAKQPKSTATGKSTPQTNSNLTAPNSQNRSQRSPSNPGNRPNVPSPLGAARPRVASDVSDGAAVGVQKVRQGAETPKGLGITNGVKKQRDSGEATKADRKTGDSAPSQKDQKPTANGAGTPQLVNSAGHKADGGVKRKAEEPTTTQSPAKHRKTDSTSSLFHQSQPSSSKTSSSMTPSPNSNSEAADSVVGTFFPERKKARKLWEVYDKEYDALKAVEDRGEKVAKEDLRQLMDMHRRLEQMYKDIEAAEAAEAEGPVDDSVLETITFGQAVKLAEKFKQYHTAYDKEYDAQQAAEAGDERVSDEDRQKLMDMHKRLAQMQREIQAGSERETEEDRQKLLEMQRKIALMQSERENA